jgi:hypothetical protein
MISLLRLYTECSGRRERTARDHADVSSRGLRVCPDLLVVVHSYESLHGSCVIGAMQPLLAASISSFSSRVCRSFSAAGSVQGRRRMAGPHQEHLLRFEGGNPEHGFVTTIAQVPDWLACGDPPRESRAVRGHPRGCERSSRPRLVTLLHHRGGLYRELLQQKVSRQRLPRARRGAGVHIQTAS